MKKIFALLLLSVLRLCAQSEEIDMHAHGKLTLYIDDSWTFNTSDFGDRMMINVAPKGDANATCSLTITFPDQDKLDTKSRLRQRVEVNGMQMAEQSVEGKAAAKEFTLRSGFGFFCNFTDPDLVGKKPVKGNYKTITQGMIHVAPDVLVEVGISADGFTSAPYQALLGMIEGMEFAPAGRKRAN